MHFMVHTPKPLRSTLMIKEFYRPATLQEAIDLKRGLGDRAVWFGGGTCINTLTFEKIRDIAISLENLGLDYIREEDDRICIGASVTLQKILDSTVAPGALKRMISLSMTRTVRNMATIAGKIFPVMQISGLPVCLLAMNAQVKYNEGEISPLEEYITLDVDGLIREIRIPKESAGAAVRYCVQKSNGPCIAATSVHLKTDGGSVVDARAFVACDSSGVVRLRETESLITGDPKKHPDAIREWVMGEVTPSADILGSIEYKKFIIANAVTDCVMECLQGEPQ